MKTATKLPNHGYEAIEKSGSRNGGYHMVPFDDPEDYDWDNEQDDSGLDSGTAFPENSHFYDGNFGQEML